MLRQDKLGFLALAFVVAASLFAPALWADHGQPDHGRAVHGGKANLLAGTWTLVAANKQLPDGSVVADYGTDPQGRLMVDDEGRYSLQIMKIERQNFETGAKATGTAEEYKSAMLGLSTHYGMVVVDETAHLLTFTIENSSFPNWRGAVQKRTYELKDGVLSYRVPPRPDGSIPLSIWRRVN